MTPVRVVKGKRRRRRSERAQFRNTLRSCAHQFIGGFESHAGRMFVEAMTNEARANGRPLGGGPCRLSPNVITEIKRMADDVRAWCNRVPVEWPIKPVSEKKTSAAQAIQVVGK